MCIRDRPKGGPRKIRTLEARRLPEGKQTVEDGKSIAAGFSLAHRKDVKPKFKYQVICRHQAEYPVSAMCRFFGVSGSSYHDYIKRLGQAHKDAALAEKLRVQQAHCWLPPDAPLAGNPGDPPAVSYTLLLEHCSGGRRKNSFCLAVNQPDFPQLHAAVNQLSAANARMPRCRRNARKRPFPF